MIAALCLASLIAGAQPLGGPENTIIESPLRRERLPNGAWISVETMPGAPTFSLILTCSAAGVADDPASHGVRHLVEHLWVKGRSGDLDRRLESRGIALLAETTRDGMAIELLGPGDALPMAFLALAELLGPPTTTPEQIAHEVKILRQEFAIVPDSQRMAARAWREVYGDAGLDPFGDLAALSSATPEQVSEAARAQLGARGVTVTLAGPMERDVAFARVRDLVAGLEPGPDRLAPDRLPAVPDQILVVPNAEGSVRGAVTPGLASPVGVATLAAGFALRVAIDGADILYTPSAWDGLVLVTHRDPGGLDGIDALIDTQAGRLYQIGRATARVWIREELTNPSGSARLRGRLLSQNPGTQPEWIAEEIERMTREQFVAALEGFRVDRAVMVEGGQ